MNKELEAFLDEAKRQGASDESLVVLLRGRGWPEEDACRALADHFEFRSGAAVPPYRRSTSAKDVFYYLLSFSMLGTWTIASGAQRFPRLRQKQSVDRSPVHLQAEAAG